MEEAIRSDNVSPASLYSRGKNADGRSTQIRQWPIFSKAFCSILIVVSALTHAARTLSTKLGKPEEAIEMLDRAIELDPDNETATIDRSVLLAQLGRADGGAARRE